jgi:uncharacterized iron-regulated membrane protein
MTRSFWVWLHRWTGLAVAGFLAIVGLTGSVLAFKDDLDLWLNPDLLRVAPRDGPMLDPLLLREKAEALVPRYRVDGAPLHLEAGHSYAAGLAPRMKAQAAKDIVASPEFLAGVFDDDAARMLYLDPYTGEKLGERKLGEVSLSRKNIVWFLYRLHMTLALPEGYVGLGARALGVVALLWTIDCFVSFYLTFPMRLVRSAATRKSWLSRWKPAWLIKWSGGAYRVNFDIHRAFGLWTWAMLFVFAWSSVAFNLNEVYAPVTNALFGAPPEPMPEPLPRTTALENPRLAWFEARERGRELLEDEARTSRASVKRETILVIDRNSGRYTMCADMSKGTDEQPSCVEFDADTGERAQHAAPAMTEAKRPLSETITWWVTSLHMARVFGLPMRIFVCAMGFVIVALSATGVYIWLRKRAARKFHFVARRRGTPDRVAADASAPTRRD